MTWVLMLVLLLCSGILSGSETALFALTRHDLRCFAHDPSLLRRRAASLMRRPRHVLLTLVILNTAVNVAIFAVAFVTFENVGETHPLLASAGNVGALLAVVVFGEFLPKSVALAHARRLAPLVAPLAHAAQLAIAPVRWALLVLVVEPVTRLLQPSAPDGAILSTEELRTLVESSARQDVISSTENEMLQAVVGLADVNVRAVMVPRIDVVAVSVHDSADPIAAAFRQTGWTQLPVYGKNLDDIQGLIGARDFYLHPHEAVTRLRRPVDFVPEQANLVHVMGHFRTRRNSLAIVVDEYGGTAGLIRLEDVLREIVGDLPRQASTRPRALAERIDPNTYRVSGGLSVREWASLFGVPPDTAQVNTLGGLVTAWIGRLPRVGDVVRRGNLILTVESVRRRRIEYLMVRRESSAGTAWGAGESWKRPG